MEFDPFTKRSPEVITDKNQETAEKPEKELRHKKDNDKAARIRRLAVSQALDPAARRREKIPELSAQRHPEAFNLQPMQSNTEKLIGQPSDREQPSSKANLQRLTTPELLQVAGKIVIEGKNVKSLYESNQIDYRGLNAIVREALRGGNTEAVLEKYQLGAEAQRGRQIEIRHDNPSTTPHVITDYDQPSKTVNELIDQIEAREHRPLIKSASATNQVAAQPPFTEEARQKARQTIRKKRLITIVFSVSLGIAIGASLAIFII